MLRPRAGARWRNDDDLADLHEGRPGGGAGRNQGGGAGRHRHYPER